MAEIIRIHSDDPLQGARIDYFFACCRHQICRNLAMSDWRNQSLLLEAESNLAWAERRFMREVKKAERGHS